MKNYDMFKKNFDGDDKFKDFRRWLMKIQYHYREEYRRECKKNGKRMTDTGYYEFLLRNEH